MCPEKDMESLRLPGRETVRLNTVKLDCLMMLLNRHNERQNTARCARHLLPDSSPQGRHDFFLCIEDRYYREETVPFDPLKGFRWVRHRMPVAAVGSQQGSAVAKSQKLLHFVCLEQGTGRVNQWRAEVKGLTPDQGTEFNIERQPFGAAENVKQAIADYLLKGQAMRDPEVRANYLLMHCLV